MSGVLFVVIVITLIGISSAGPAVFPGSPVRGPVVVPITLLPRPYEFGFEFGDGFGMSQLRREVADGSGAVKGSYGYVDPSGVTRIVDYIADSDGYKAVIRSNEPGISTQNAADAAFIVHAPPPAAVAEGLRPKLVI